MSDLAQRVREALGLPPDIDDDRVILEIWRLRYPPPPVESWDPFGPL